MAEKIEKVASTDKPDRLKVVWGGFSKRIKDLGLPGFSPKEPDWKPVEAALKQGGKAADFQLRFTNGKLVAEVSCAGTVLTVAALNTDQEKDRARKRALLQTIRDKTDLLSTADLQEWDKKNPDPARVQQLQFERDNLKTQVQAIEKGIVRPKTWDQMKEGEREGSFRSWMRRKNYDRYTDCLSEHGYGREATALFEEYFKDGAKRPIQVSDAIRKEMGDAIAANRKPDMSKAMALVEKSVNAIIPTYNKESDAQAKENLPLLKKQLAEKEKELRDAGGR